MLADPIRPNPRTLAVGRLTRRTALIGVATTGAALAVAACTPKKTVSATEMIAGDGLGPLYTETRAMIARYDGAIANAPELTGVLGPLREEHRQHLIALASLIGLATPAISPGPHASGIPLPPLHSGSPGSSGSAGAQTSGTAAPSTAAPGSTTPSARAPGTAPGSTTQTQPAGPPASAPSTSPPASAPSTSPSASAAALAATKAALSNAEKTAQTNAVAACIAAATDRVAVVAAIAACRATHVAALR